MLSRALILAALSTLGLAASPCTTGTPTVTAGYTIDYAPAKPTIAFEEGYKPEPAWASSHVAATYSFGVPEPIETGFAYAQFKCQHYCANNGAGGFFVDYPGPDATAGSNCVCFDDLIDPDTFVTHNESWVGAWNPICK
ncbi:hypothetical protein F4810DRAFT_709730 [Camillea tinctor]|nr:hypothetical protein F4810DRAFT_709730 [Camillea tinctor]